MYDKLVTFGESKTYFGDAESVMKMLKNKNITVDAIITDPPYNISRENNFNTIGREGFNWKWDKKFDLTSWLSSAIPLLKLKGNIIIFNDWKNLGIITTKLNTLGCVEKDIIVWKKTNPMPRNLKRRYLPQLEFILWAVKVKETRNKAYSDKRKNNNSWTFNLINKNKNSPIIVYKNHTQKRIHPTQKPVGLLEKIISIHTNKNDLILDPFSGSGSLGIASFNKKRKFILIENNKKYYNAAVLALKNSFYQKVYRSPVYHIGDKYRILPQILKKLPKKITTFYDIFGGGGTVMSNIIADNIVYNDQDKHLTKLIKEIYKDSKKKEKLFLEKAKEVIQDYDLFMPSENKQKIKKRSTTKNKNNFYKLRDDYNNLPNKFTQNASIILFVLLVYSFNSQIRFNSKGEFNTPIGKADLNFNRINVFNNFQKLLREKNIVFWNLDFKKALDKVISEKRKNSFVYLDPPYLVTNAQYNCFWTKKQEAELLKYLNKLMENKIKWGLSNAFSSKNTKNILLLEWLKSNQKQISILKINSSHKNSNYQRKGNDVEEAFIYYDGKNRK